MDEINVDLKKKIIFLPKSYDLVVGDRFELFYRGIIRAFDPYQYYIKIDCDKGKPYGRYFTYTPTEGDVGEYVLNVRLFTNLGELLDSSSTILKVAKPVAPKEKVTILCIGDSLTCGGYWCAEGYRRFALSGGEPCGLGYSDSIELIGTVKKEVENGIYVGHEGYGCWQWKTFCAPSGVSTQSAVWIEAVGHNKTSEDQHSVWVCNGLKWVLETIEKDRLKFKRGEGNTSFTPVVKDEFVHLENAIHTDSIKVTKFEFENVNPFWNEEVNDIDFKNYCKKNGFNEPNFVYILLSWNGLYIPYNEKFTMQEEYAPKLIDKLHEQFPNCLIKCMGIPLNSINGGIAANYGAKGPYHDVFGDVVTAFNYNDWLERLCLSEKYNSFVQYIDVKSQFDVEYNMPYQMVKVNNRNETLEMIGTNGVHPSINGYMQIGDVFYRSLVHTVIKK